MSQDFISSSIENLLLAVLFACKCSSYFLNLNDVNFDWWLFHIFFNLVHFLILAISHFFIFSFAQKYILCLYLCNFNPVCAKTILTAVLNCLLYSFAFLCGVGDGDGWKCAVFTDHVMVISRHNSILSFPEVSEVSWHFQGRPPFLNFFFAVAHDARDPFS